MNNIIDRPVCYCVLRVQPCMLFKIKSDPMHPLSGALALPYVPACVTRLANLVAKRHSFASL